MGFINKIKDTLNNDDSTKNRNHMMDTISNREIIENGDLKNRNNMMDTLSKTQISDLNEGHHLLNKNSDRLL